MTNHAQTAAYLQAIGSPTRLRIIEALIAGPKHVSAIAEAIDVDLANTSHHLKVLRTASLVLSEKLKRNVIYALNRDIYTDHGKTWSLDLGWCQVVKKK